MNYFFLSMAVLFNISAYIIFKSISGRQNDLAWTALFCTGLILAGINTWFFTRSLKDLNLSVAYPVFSAASILIIILISLFLFHEKISLVNVFGGGLVIAGIVLLTR